MLDFDEYCRIWRLLTLSDAAWDTSYNSWRSRSLSLSFLVIILTLCGLGFYTDEKHNILISVLDYSPPTTELS